MANEGIAVEFNHAGGCCDQYDNNGKQGKTDSKGQRINRSLGLAFVFNQEIQTREQADEYEPKQDQYDEFDE